MMTSRAGRTRIAHGRERCPSQARYAAKTAKAAVKCPATSKAAVAVIIAPDTEPAALQRWFAESGDVRNDAAIFEEIALFLRDHEVHTVAMTKEMMGCPHEEGIDYPEGEACPECPFWAGRARPIDA